MSEFTHIIGFMGALGTTLAFVPQVIQTMKTKDTKSISLGMYIVFISGLACWLTYGILIKDIPLIIANAITLALADIILGMKLKYK